MSLGVVNESLSHSLRCDLPQELLTQAWNMAQCVVPTRPKIGHNVKPCATGVSWSAVTIGRQI